MSGQSAPSVDVPRRVALDVVRAVSDSGAYANLLLPGRLRSAGLSGRDAAFSTELTYGTLRLQGTYDRIIDACVTGGRALDAAVRDVLRLGVHQLLSMNVPDHAAVATTVELAKVSGSRRASGLVNAVMRRVSAVSLAGWLDRLTRGLDENSDTAFAIRHGHPTWLVTALRSSLQAHGRSPAELAELLRCNNVPAAVTLASWPGRSTVDELLVPGAARGLYSPHAVALQRGDPGDIPAVRERRAGVQDEGSQLMAMALPVAPIASGEPERWLDMCAGPGGKAALLGSLAEMSGATLQAWEVAPHRANLVRQQVAESVTVRVTDAADEQLVSSVAGSFHRVLLDAPCSGAGALRRRPEARWRKSLDDLPALVAGQQRLLHAALRLVRPGGVVAYVTCSPLLDETTHVVDTVLAHSQSGHSAFRAQRLDARTAMPSAIGELGPGPDVQLWPHEHQTDSMFLAMLRRES